jgi:hypothetical protein
MTVNKFWLAPTIGNVLTADGPINNIGYIGNWWEALFNLIAISLLCFTIVYFLPYQVQVSNHFHAGILFSLWWIACISFMSVNLPYNPDQIDRQLDYILIAGLVPFILLGDYVIKARYAHLSTFATSLIEEYKVDAEAKKKAAAKAAEIAATTKTGPKVVRKDASKDVKGKDAKGKDVKGAKGKDAAKDGKDVKAGNKTDAGKEEADNIAKAQKAALLALEQTGEDDEKKRNTRLYLPRILQDFNAGVSTIDIVGRLLWHFIDDKTSLEVAAHLYEQAEKAYPEVPYVKVLRVSYCTSLATDPSVHLPKLDVIKKMEPGLLSRYYVYKRAVDIRDRAKVSSSSEGENSLDLVAYIEFQNLFR